MTSRQRALDSLPPKVVIVGLNYSPETTGIAPYTTGLARHLAARGFNVTAITGYPHYPQWKRHAGYERRRPPEWDHGVRLVRVAHPVPGNPGGVSRVLMEAVFGWRALPHIRRERPNVVIAVSPALLGLVPGAALRRVLGFGIGAVVQDLYGAALAETDVVGHLLARLTAKLEAGLLRRMDGIAVIHDVFRRKLLAAGVPEDRIVIVPNWTHVSAAETPDREAARRSLGWNKEDFVALHAGNMGAKQGLEGLVDVARRADERGSAVRVVLLGDGSRRQSLLSYGRNVRQLTILESLPAGRFEAVLAASDCLLLHEKPGVVEMSVPSKLTTYFAAGRPVVAATDPRSGAASLMRDAKAGITVRPGDPEALLRAIEQLATDPLAALRFGNNGRRYASEHLSSAASLTAAEEWVRSLLRQN